MLGFRVTVGSGFRVRGELLHPHIRENPLAQLLGLGVRVIGSVMVRVSVVVRL